MSYIITIGRQYGSGGRFIGQELAKKLNIKFYDNNLLEKVAADSGLSISFIQSHEEKKDSIFAYLGLPEGSNFLAASQRVSIAQFDTISRIAQSNESCVIVGRCADYILREYKNLVSVFIHAPIEERIARAQKFYNLNVKKVDDYIRKIDKKRAAYYDYFTNKTWGSADSYDLCLDSSIGINESVQLIEDFLKIKLKDKVKF